MNTLEDFIKLNSTGKKISIGVIGDAMLDEYFSVSVKKISPEFPIPVMHSDVDHSENYPGGAANVAYQFKHFNCSVRLISFLDREAFSLLICKGIDTSLCLHIKNKIPRKRRFYSNGFPTYRWDVEQKDYGLGKDLKYNCLGLYEKAQDYISNFDVMIFSDYDKGVFSNHLYDLVRSAKLSIVDPKSGGLNRWVGCTVFKPNKQEALLLSGCDTVEEAGKFLLNKLQCKAVVITQAGDGVTVFDKEGLYEIKPTCKLPLAESVIGAGDCFVAFLAMALARGMSIRKSAEIAWQAGVLYVKNRYNKPVSESDIVQSFDPSLSKILYNNYLFLKDRDFKLVFTNGCFDILHSGHLHILREAKKLGDKLVVGINTDQSVSRIKNGRPIIPLEERMALLAALDYVDYVIPFSEATPLNLIEEILPDVLVKGGEYKKEDIAGHEIALEVVTIPMKEGLSTTNIIEKIKAYIKYHLIDKWPNSCKPF
jgi:D-beta-D-heptose 7-phosphate kinase/D-beta-D-heptose 1-phosphate adenosyltransferase